ncbi:hypothetical protein [Streptomyces sp. NPDC006996]|uniref:hypothetical protein n=1 Tax=Streptomyces sp. NPDC006996 TaxID=3156908 RepID=UPI0033E68901
MHALIKGLLAGAVGTVALNVVTYGDMLVRGRPSSDTPAEVADVLADRTGVELGQGDQKSHREQVTGALLGYVTGLGVGAVYGLFRGRGMSTPHWMAGPLLGASAMAGSDVPATALRVTDPSSWGVSSWLSDIAPHLAYGITTASVFDALR